MSSTNVRDVFQIVEAKDIKTRWVKIGTAFINKDGSLNVFLDALPLNGKMQIRERKYTATQKKEE